MVEVQSLLCTKLFLLRNEVMTAMHTIDEVNSKNTKEIKTILQLLARRKFIINNLKYIIFYLVP